jgi:hypothetical protein
MTVYTRPGTEPGTFVMRAVVLKYCDNIFCDKPHQFGTESPTCGPKSTRLVAREDVLTSAASKS